MIKVMLLDVIALLWQHSLKIFRVNQNLNHLMAQRAFKADFRSLICNSHRHDSSLQVKQIDLVELKAL
jgi:hypothetical protein